jgi:hypothetical protein
MDRTFTLSELIPIIEHCALDLMNAPIINGKKPDEQIHPHHH